jgi:hypothetical protein
VDPVKRADLIIEAALEWGADPMYDVQPGTLGQTLYIDCTCKQEASHIRNKAPIYFHGLYVVVRYPTHILTYEDVESEIEVEEIFLNPDLYHPK